MPALDPVCARVGTLASTTAAAVASATAREAGLTGRTLLGGLATIIWTVSVPRPGTQTMDGTGYGQHTTDALAAAKPSVTKPCEYGSTGAALPGSISGRSRRIYA